MRIKIPPAHHYIGLFDEPHPSRAAAEYVADDRPENIHIEVMIGAFLSS